ncbi:RNA recognition motif domain-containing protein [Phthorimaea operculella]|nr:RNA recognition motif domain-containing protein [Phthorimaea operculella]
MEGGVKRYIRSESASCAHMVEESAANNRKSADPHEKLKALLNSPEDDTDDTLPPSDAPKFGTVIHNRIFVGGFSLTTTDEDLWKFFSGFATVTAARVIYDRAGVSKCYGFVTFASPRVARLIVKQGRSRTNLPDYSDSSASSIESTRDATRNMTSVRQAIVSHYRLAGLLLVHLADGLHQDIQTFDIYWPAELSVPTSQNNFCLGVISVSPPIVKLCSYWYSWCFYIRFSKPSMSIGQ